MKKIQLLAFYLVLLTLFACGDTKLLVDIDEEKSQGEVFELRPSQSVDIKKTLLSLSFTKVTEGRCPQGTSCVWAGEGKVILKAKHDQEIEEFILIAKGLCDDAEAKCGQVKNFRGYDIELISLSPYPQEGKKITANEYVAKLKVTKGAM
ncbi:MAG: hypothetical protein AB8G15_06185 [Saprospiraceae bacterium]